MTDTREIKVGPTNKILLEMIPRAFNPYDKKLCGIWIKTYDDKHYIHAMSKDNLDTVIKDLTIIADKWNNVDDENAETEVNNFLTGTNEQPIKVEDLDDFIIIDDVAVKIPYEEENTDN